MNSAQRDAIEQAIRIEQDWLYLANCQHAAAGQDKDLERSITYHEKRLSELREGE